MENFKMTKGMLKNGKVLCTIMEMYNEDGSEKNFNGVLRCLRDSNVIVPITVNLAQEDADKIANTDPRFFVNVENNINASTELIESTNGEKYFPVFSQIGQIADKYKNTVANFISVPFVKVLKMAATYTEAKGIAVDPFTNSFIVPADIYEAVGNLPSEIENQ